MKPNSRPIKLDTRLVQQGIGRLVWTPKWKWFKPPRWKIFRWAYRYTVVNRNMRTYTNETFAQLVRDCEKKPKGMWVGEVEHPED